MKLRLLTAAAAAATLFAAGQAAATVAGTNSVATATFAEFQFAINSGETYVTGFESTGTGLVEALSTVVFDTTGYGLSGTGSLVTTWDGDGAPPATDIPPTDRDTTRYLTVRAGQAALLTLPNISKISLYVGSIDGYNKMHIVYADNSFDDLNGSWISDNTIADAVTGNQYTGGNNGRLTMSFEKKVKSINFISDQNSYEISNIGAVIPEPASWAMMIVGFGLVGSAVRSQRRRPAATTA